MFQPFVGNVTNLSSVEMAAALVPQIRAADSTPVTVPTLSERVLHTLFKVAMKTLPLSIA